MLNCIDSKNNASYNNHLNINTTNMKHISAVINTCTDEENNIFLTFSTTFVIDTPKIKEHYVDNYLHCMEKIINKHNDIDTSKLLSISKPKKCTSNYWKPLNINKITQSLNSVPFKNS